MAAKLNVQTFRFRLYPLSDCVCCKSQTEMITFRRITLKLLGFLQNFQFGRAVHTTFLIQDPEEETVALLLRDHFRALVSAKCSLFPPSRNRKSCPVCLSASLKVTLVFCFWELRWNELSSERLSFKVSIWFERYKRRWQNWGIMNYI